MEMIRLVCEFMFHAENMMKTLKGITGGRQKLRL
uniref:Uncharacterized protein n=1 Tax=Rhizophora mucronata TaxID=61149 RepID=A0A2P2P7T5_RHIMU